MADLERVPKSKEQERKQDSRELEQIQQQQHESINEAHRESLEKNGEKSHETADDIAHEALEQAKSRETDKVAKKAEREPASGERRKDRITSKSERAASYKKTMKQVESELSPIDRAFSKFIHNKAVERVSDAVGATVARPNAILVGSITAFVFTLAIFLVARYYGYPLSGTETIAAFGLGWLVGLLFDYLKLEFTGGKS